MEHGFYRKTQEKLAVVNSILDGFQKKGLKVTVRQVHYQLVAKGITPNKDNEYDKLVGLLKNGRMAGLIDWDAIEDRLRGPWKPWCVGGVEEAVQDTVDQYRLNRQEGQSCLIEVWTEKDALSGVLKRITGKYGVHLVVCRGYSSVTSMYHAHKRMVEAIERGRGCRIIYVGDHDPSGLDMVRDLRCRLAKFDARLGEHLTVEPVALTMDQIKEFDPPANKVKGTDKRVKRYRKEHGEKCWEVDALPPEFLNETVEDVIRGKMDLDQFSKILEREKEDKLKLAEIAKNVEVNG